MELSDGKLGLNVGGGRLEGNDLINDDIWHHLVVVFPSAGENLDNAVLFVDGEVQDSIISGNPIIDTGEILTFA